MTKTLPKSTLCPSVALLACLALLIQPLPAQEPVTTMSVNVKVVNLPVTVRDKHGKVVRNLTKDDFTLEEDGRPQTIKYFSQDANLPLTLGLLVDTSFSQRSVLDEERSASRTFLDQMLKQDKDKAFVIHFDREVELLQDLTSSRDKLQRALDELRTPQPQRDPADDNGGPPQGGQRRMRRGGTQLYDAVFLASDELMKKQQGRKALIILSDGVDRGSKTSLEGAIEAAQRADTIVYSILFKGPQEFERGGYDHDRRGGMGGGWPRGGGGGWPGGGGGSWPGGGGGGWPGGGGRGGRGGGQRPSEQPRVDGKKILEQISKETGGRMFEVSKKETIAGIYSTIAEELRTQYDLGYTPDRKENAEGYHRIKLTAKNKDYSVQTRDGYYADH
jgi:VWFA-related protein